MYTVPPEFAILYVVEVNYVCFVVDSAKLTEFVQQAQNIVEKSYIDGRYIYHTPNNTPNIVIYPILEPINTLEEVTLLKEHLNNGKQ